MGFAAACVGEQQGSAVYEADGAEIEPSYGAAQQAIAACAGDDLQYDFNGFAASLAAAIANELSRWDVATDLVLQGDRLELSSTGLSMCKHGCENVQAILALQDESSAGIPTHDPAIFRAKLTSWYRAEMAKLSELAAAARQAPGSYRLRNRAGVAFTGMYVITARHSGKVLAVSDSEEDSLVTQQTYSDNDDLHHWYVYPVDERYQLVNRHSGKCMALLTDSPRAPLAQKNCRVEDSQLFSLDSINGGVSSSISSAYHRPLEVDGARSDDGAKIRQVSGDIELNRQFLMTPILGAEPHRLSFSHATADGPCGDYYWYDIARPNGAPLINPDQMYTQLIFAGGKTRLDGIDENPFIAQVVKGSKVAIDPSGYMTGGGDGTSGSCVQADVLYDPSRSSAGKCCIKYNGTSGVFVVSSWSSTTYLCN
ncbi:MAG: RICIN domain-containing protein [Deltaproteobacteria bacterium]